MMLTEMTPAPGDPLGLTCDERETLEQWSRRPKTSQALAERARPWTAEDGSLALPASTWVAAATA